MANNSEMIETGALAEYKEVRKLNAEFLKTVENINKVNNAAKNLKLPSQFVTSINSLNNVLKTTNSLMRAQVQLQERLVNAANASTTATNNNTTANINNERAERERIRTERERLRLSEDQRRAEERQQRSTNLLGSAYLQLSRQQAAAARVVQDLIVRGRTATQTQREYDRELQNAQREFDRLNQRVTTADRAVGRFNRNVGNYPMQAVRGIKDLVGAFGIVGGVTAFAMVAKDVFQTTKELQSLGFAMKQVVGTQEGFAKSQEFLTRISEAYGIEINGLTRSYTGFYAAAKNAIDAGEITSKQINDIFESVAKASGAMGLSVEQQQGAFLALQQMISKGNVQAEEIRGQLAERLPGAFGILAKSMGVTEIELNKLLKDGKVMAAEVLPEFAKQLEKAYGIENLNRVETLAAATTRLGNEWTNLIRTFSESDGVISKSLRGIIKLTADVVKGFNLIAGGERSRDNYLQEGIRETALRTELAIYEELNKEIGEAATLEKARENAAFHQEQINQLEAERRALLANIQATKDARAERAKDGVISNFFDILGDDKTIRQQSQALEDNAIQLGKFQGALDAANQTMEDGVVVNKKYYGGDKKKNQKADIDYLRAINEQIVQNINFQIEQQERLMNNEDKNYTVRLDAANAYYAKQEELLNIQAQEAQRLNDLEYKNQKETYAAALKEGTATNTNLIELERQYYIKRQTIDENYLNKKSDLTIEAARKLKGVLDAINDQQEVNIIDEEQLANLRQLNMELNNVTPNTSYAKFKELEERKTAIVEDGEERRIRVELRRTQALMAGMGVDEQNSKTYVDLRNKEIKLTTDLQNAEQARYDKSTQLTLELKRATDEYLSSFSDGIFGDLGLTALEQFFKKGEDGLTQFERNFKGAGDNISKQFAVVFTTVTEIAQQAFNLLNQNSQQRLENDLAEIDMQQRLAERFAITEEAKQQIQDQADEKRREARNREAKQQKEIALFNAIVNTAQGVVAALPNIPLSVLVGALGAAQIALIASQDIPQFKDGVRNFGGGLAVVGDGGRSEIVRTKDGGLWRTPSTDTLVDLPKGADVFKSDTDFLRNSGTLFGGLPNIGGDGTNFKADMYEVMNSVLAGNVASNNISIDKRGIRAFSTNQNSITKSHNNLVTFTGVTFKG